MGEVLRQLTGTADGVTQTDVVSLLTQWGVLGAVVVLLLLGWLVPRPTVELLREQLRRAEQSHDKEQEAHATTRAALAQETRRGDAAVEAAQTATRLLEAFQAGMKQLGPP